MNKKSPFELRSLWRKGSLEDDFGPWFHLWGQAVYAHTAVIGAAIFSMLFTTVAITFKTGWLEVLRFSTEAILGSGEIWRVLSYAVWNPPDLGFAIQMLVLWWFGREIEGFFGRRTFLQLFMGMLLVPALVALSLVNVPFLGLAEMTGLSGVSISLQFLVAYATLSPQVSFFYGIPIKWVAAAVVGIQTLATVANHDWPHLAVDLAGIGFAFGFVRNRMGLLELPTLRLPVWSRKKPAPAFYVVKQQTAALQPAPNTGSSSAATTRKHTVSLTKAASHGRSTQVLDSIDPLLEKISRSGMGSLTAEEKAMLQEAREALLQQPEKK
jgi:hypothetical protein